MPHDDRQHAAALAAAWLADENALILDTETTGRWQRLPGGDHTALGDCRATLAVLRQMAGEEVEE